MLSRPSQRRHEAIRPRRDDLALGERLRELVRTLDGEGYFPDLQSQREREWRIRTQNYPVRAARRYARACGGEISFLRKTLPVADLRRPAHPTSGHACRAYPLSSPTSEPGGSRGVEN